MPQFAGLMTKVTFYGWPEFFKKNLEVRRVLFWLLPGWEKKKSIIRETTRCVWVGS